MKAVMGVVEIDLNREEKEEAIVMVSDMREIGNLRMEIKMQKVADLIDKIGTRRETIQLLLQIRVDVATIQKLKRRRIGAIVKDK
jgi:hypothetical protein